MDHKEREKMKDLMIKNIERKIKNNQEPNLEYDEEKGIAYHWLKELWSIAHTAGELSSISMTRQLLNSDLNELDDIEELGKKNFKRTLQ